MSNKIVPTIYRTVIDDVIAAVKADFDSYGVGEDVLAELQHKWEAKVIASHVADFEPTAPHPPAPVLVPIPNYSVTHNPYNPSGSSTPAIKAEPMENRTALSAQYSLPPLPGPQLNTSSARMPPQPHSLPPHMLYQHSGSSSGTPVARSPVPPTHRPYQPSANGQPPRIPQVDGPSSSSSDSPSPPANPTYAPHSAHPSLPQPSQATTSGSQVRDSEEINSDLDDSDTEGDEEVDETGPGESDIVFCTYDKVQRVKNKWKCVLKDGMIHVNGKDYLFAKCSGEFEW